MGYDEKYIKDGKDLAHFGFKLKVLPGSLTDEVPRWDNAA
jgi:hypothetical protein